jgi:hypothetical protein
MERTDSFEVEESWEVMSEGRRHSLGILAWTDSYFLVARVCQGGSSEAVMVNGLIYSFFCQVGDIDMEKQ